MWCTTIILFLPFCAFVHGQNNDAENVCQLSGCTCTNAWSGKYFVGTSIVLMKGISVSRCLIECSENNACRSVTYKKAIKEGSPAVCFLNSDASMDVNKWMKDSRILRSENYQHFEVVACDDQRDKQWKKLTELVCDDREKVVQRNSVKEQHCNGSTVNVKQFDCACSQQLYRRAEDDQCVPKEQCDEIKKNQKCPKNEEYVSKGECFDEIMCNRKRSRNSVCDKGCVCMDGYVRKEKKCIPKKKCIQRGKRDTSQRMRCGTPVAKPNLRAGRIVNGEEARRHSWPWIAQLNMGCGGSIYNRWHIITAAHCIQSFVIEITVTVGSHFWGKRTKTGERIKSSKIAIHPDYNTQLAANDIAIIKLRRPITYAFNRLPICLPTKDAPEDGDAVIAGWGALTCTNDVGRIVVQYGSWYFPSSLMQAVVPIISRTVCNSADHYWGFIKESMICAGGIGRDACQGDSGGPLVSKNEDGVYELQGITSFGFGCNDPEFPGVYSRVVYLKGWIKRQIAL